MRKKRCIKCKRIKPIVNFYLRRQKDRAVKTALRRSECKVCMANGSKTRYERRKVKELELRTNNPAKCIVTDSKRSDRKYGRDFGLTLEFVETTISKGCTYCGEKSIRMTLDRIDNNKGHVPANVVSACIRCNYVRRDMPYSAWLVIAPAMQAAREAGFFGDWTARTKSLGGGVGRRTRFRI